MIQIEKRKRTILEILSSHEYGWKGIDESLDTYFEDVDNDGDDAYEYGHNTIQDLRSMLGKKRVLHDEALDMQCAILAYEYERNRQQDNEHGNPVKTEDAIDWIYKM